MSNVPHVLVIGAGSAGKRHARNLRELGCRISAFDPRADRRDDVAREGAIVASFASLDEALAAASYDGFLIASPPTFHVDQVIQALEAGKRWVLCEKPLSITAAEARRLEPYADRVALAYTYRWWPPVQRFRERLLSGEIGQVRNLRFVMSAHLEDWHPWEQYQQFFMASRELGGGALLDESHFLDLMLWFLGTPARLYAEVDKISRLEIDTDDNVDVIATYADGRRVNLHLDLIGRPHQRSITAVGDDGTLVYSYESNAITVGHTGAQEWATEQFTCERNEMFLGAAREFVALMRGADGRPSCGVADGIRALDAVDACRRSSAEGVAVSWPK